MSNANKLSVIEICKALHDMTREERSTINQTILYLAGREDAEKRDEFRYGDKVKFSPRKRGWPSVITGTVVKRNVKTIEVRPDNGGRNWRVSASLLSKA